MNGLSSNPWIFTSLAVLAAYLMTASGLRLKRLVHRVTCCPVCHRPRTQCTCRWL